MGASDAAGADEWPWPDAPEPLPAPVVDNHCHLDVGIRGGHRIEVAEALDRAAAVGVPRIVQVGCDLEDSRWAVEVAREFDAIVAAVALHPNEAPRLAEAGGLDAALAEIDALAGDPVAVILAARCAVLAAEPPEDWDGVYEQRSK